MSECANTVIVTWCGLIWNRSWGWWLISTTYTQHIGHKTVLFWKWRRQSSRSKLCFAQLSCLNRFVGQMLCSKWSTPSLSIAFEKTVGLSVLLAATSSTCTFSTKVHSSERIAEEGETISSWLLFEVNRRAALAVKEVTLGAQGLQKLCDVMNVKGGLHHKTF